MDKILIRIKNLNEQNIAESLVIGFDVYLSSVKKIDNSDLIVAIDQENSDYNIVTFKSHADFSFADYGTRCGFRCDLYDGDYRYKTALRYGVLYKKT